MRVASQVVGVARCLHCGYERGELPPDSLCPECGEAWGEGLQERVQSFQAQVIAYGVASGVLLLPLVMVPINLIWAYWVHRLPATDPNYPNWIQTGDYPVIDATYKPMFACVLFLGWLWLPMFGWAIWLSVFGWRLRERAGQQLWLRVLLILLLDAIHATRSVVVGDSEVGRDVRLAACSILRGKGLQRG